MSFSQIAIGSQFTCNGNICIKKSSRTALLIAYGRTFYFSKNDRCGV
jgi:hypothetical protein